MTFPVGGYADDVGGPEGHTYAAVLVGRGPETRPVRQVLRDLRFTGWLAPPDAGRLVVVPGRADRPCASGRRDVLALADVLAVRLGADVLAARVLADRQLVLAGWRGGQAVGRYVSDPAVDQPDPAGVLDEPWGVEHAEALATCCGRPGAGEALAEILAAELDADSVIESERLGDVLALLDLPTWLVGIPSLPGDVPTGPSRRELTRFGAGFTGPLGVLGRVGTGPLRRRRSAPAVLAPPRRRVDLDPWLM